MGFRVWALGFRVKVWGLGVRVYSHAVVRAVVSDPATVTTAITLPTRVIVCILLHTDVLTRVIISKIPHTHSDAVPFFSSFTSLLTPDDTATTLPSRVEPAY